MSRVEPFGIVDIFAGPGGLSEGFGMLGDFDSRPFKIALSIEKDSAAHRTLRLRSLVHELNEVEFERYIEILNNNDSLHETLFEEAFPDKWRIAESIAKGHELSEATRQQTEAYLDDVIKEYGSHTGLIGGPPCQVYSLVGRSRNAKNHLYQGDDDHRHTLYKEYIHVLNYLKPAFFVMENVKGMLSSTHQSRLVFPLVKNDLESAAEGYRLFALAPERNELPLLRGSLTDDHRNFIVRMEEFGVPQNRHRIIILGIRNGILRKHPEIDPAALRLPQYAERVTVDHALNDLPPLRSGISRAEDSTYAWQTAIRNALNTLHIEVNDPRILSVLEEVEEKLVNHQLPTERHSDEYSHPRMVSQGLARLHHHETRAHIESDIVRYLFASAFAKVHQRSPRASEFPKALAPGHANWNSGNFNDRFRVQVGLHQSSTVMSHISKDGHYYIHPDPLQARSLTVREAARLQTFPDDYIFLGNRTQQYHQVGNAVPPVVASLIAAAIEGMNRNASTRF